MDLESRRRWEEYTKAKEVMLERTHIPEAPLVGGRRRWTRSGRGSTASITSSSSSITTRCRSRPIVLPERERHDDYSRQAVPAEMFVPEVY